MTVICIRKVFFMYEHPGEQTLVIFDYYSPGRYGIHVAPSSHLESCDSASEMLVQIPRAARSDGRIDLHLMITGEGPILFPMRTSTATLHDRLVAATQEIPPGSTREEALEHVKSIVTSLVKEIKRDPDFELIH
jgi:hypothetical protein